MTTPDDTTPLNPDDPMLLAALRDIDSLLGDLPPDEPPPALVRSTLQAIETDPIVEPVRTRRRPPRRLVAAAVLIAGGAAAFAYLGQRSAPSRLAALDVGTAEIEQLLGSPGRTASPAAMAPADIPADPRPMEEQIRAQLQEKVAEVRAPEPDPSAVTPFSSPPPPPASKPSPFAPLRDGNVDLSGVEGLVAGRQATQYGSGGLGSRGVESGSPAGLARAKGGRVAVQRSGKAVKKKDRVANRPRPTPAPEAGLDRDAYRDHGENPFTRVDDQPQSTFSVDVDTASYSNVRRFLREGRLPPAAAVRIEELINYFPYDYAAPRLGAEPPFSVTTEVGPAPWNPEHRLVHVGLQAPEIADGDLPPRNLVFLLDVSGSMNSPDKLGLLKQGMSLLVETLTDNDRVSIVVYAGAAGVVLEPTSGDHQNRILEAIERLRAGGSTAGGAGIRMAYDLARRNFVRGGINRVILGTDGDFNVGTSSQGELKELVEQERESGVFLTVLGFGRGNLADDRMETLADHGNGNYAYIDSVAEAKKVLVAESGGTLVAVAKDVKIQVEFNPLEVAGYRLIGYENRVLANRDFADDTKDAGEIGAGHSVTALYEIVPVDGDVPGAEPEGLRYQRPTKPTAAALDGELLTVRLRWKAPTGSTSKLIETQVLDRGKRLSSTSDDYRWSAAVAAWGMKLQGSAQVGDFTHADVDELARSAVGRDRGGYRAEFLELVQRARDLSR